MRKYLFTALIVLISLSAFGQGGVPMKTGKKYVTAIVEPGTGWVQVKQYPGNNQNAVYSFAQKSFVSFNINGKIYTNNDVVFDPVPANTYVMKDGVLKKSDDTIRCTWSNKEGVDLIQDVYPVVIGNSEQIVYRWKYRNKNAATVSVAVQYLLDLQIGDYNYVNDGPIILSRHGLRNSWTMYSKDSSRKVPPYFMAFQYYPINPSSPDFGNARYGGTAYLDSIYTINLKLKRPIQLVIGDWTELIKKRWFYTDIGAIPTSTFADGGIAMTWLGVVSDIYTSDVEVASMSYGTGDIPVCYGSLDAFSLYPKTIKFEGKPKPDTFVVETEFFQPEVNALPVQGVEATLTVGRNLKIISPKPINNSGKSQTQFLPNNGVVTTDSMSRVKWTLQVDTEDMPKGDFTSTLKFSAVSSGGVVFGGSTGFDTCEKLIYFDLPINDGLPPVFTALPPLDSSTRRISFSEIRALDSGLKSISWTFIHPPDSSNFIIAIQPIVAGCVKGIDTVTIVQKDTTKSGCIDFVAIDCAGNMLTKLYCVLEKVFVPVDTIPPYTKDHKTKDNLTKEFTVVDPLPSSNFIKSVENLPPPTLPSFNQTILFNTNCTMYGGRIIVQRVDSLQYGCVYYTITDCANNSTLDSICFVADTTLGVTDNQDKNTFSILGNPSSGKATIQLTLDKPQDITLRIVDALGREVRRVEVKGLSQGENLIPLQTSELASGTYYVLVEIDGKQYAKSLKVVR